MGNTENREWNWQLSVGPMQHRIANMPTWFSSKTLVVTLRPFHSMINEHTRQDLWMQKHLDGQIKKKTAQHALQIYLRGFRSLHSFKSLCAVLRWIWQEELRSCSMHIPVSCPTACLSLHHRIIKYRKVEERLGWSHWCRPVPTRNTAL